MQPFFEKVDSFQFDWIGPVTLAPFTWAEAGTIGLLLLCALLLGKVVAGIFDEGISGFERRLRVVVVSVSLAALWWIVIPVLWKLRG